MFEKLALEITCSMLGKKPWPLLELVIGEPRRSIAKWIDKAGATDRLRDASGNFAMDQLLRTGVSGADAKRIVAALPSQTSPFPMPFADLVWLSPGDVESKYARSLDTARNIDTFTDKFCRLRDASADAGAIRNLINDRGWLSPRWLIDPIAFEATDSIERVPAHWTTLMEAESFTELRQPLAVLATNVVFDWLASWDVDFCTTYFPSYEPLQCLEWVRPRVSQRAFNETESLRERVGTQGPAKRGLVSNPIERLLDVTSVLTTYVRAGHWPDRKPFASDFAGWAGIDTTAMGKLRSGEHRLTLKKFEGLWFAACRVRNCSDTPAPPPLPLYFAALIYNAILLQYAHKGRVTAVTLHDEALYDTYWMRHLNANSSNRIRREADTLEQWPSVLSDLQFEREDTAQPRP